MSWFLYLIECSDDSIYTGIAVDVEARYQKHLNGTGARYTRSRPPRRIPGQALESGAKKGFGRGASGLAAPGENA